ncbi:MAG: ACT domain-containing protein [Oscillospiraceae bacterium]
MQESQLIVVSASVLPEIFSKVLDVKKLLARGEEKSSAAACKNVGISRSAYYKYKDCVYSYEEKLMQKIISLYAVLKDEPGVLSSVLSTLHSLSANVLTVNQNIPIDSVATVTISLRLKDGTDEPYMLTSILSKLYGVVDIKIISGE